MVFTGIIMEKGKVLQADHRTDLVLWDGTLGTGLVLRIGGPVIMASMGMYDGVSIAVNGVCLTVTKFDAVESWFEVNAAGHTLDLTNLGSLKAGQEVNLEPPAKADHENSGHIVQGHVDCRAKILKKKREKDFLWVTFELPTKMAPLIVEKGYVAVDGTSLTVCNVTSSSFQVMLIAHTQSAVILPSKEPGDLVNLEGDVQGKYLLRYTQVMNTGLIHKAPLYLAAAAMALSLFNTWALYRRRA